MPEEKDQLTVEEEEDLIRVQLEEVHESPAVKEQIARVLREAYREKFGTDPEPGSSKRPSKSHKDPVDELDDLPSSELDELEEKYGQSIEVTSEGQARLKGSERQEKERREKAKPATEMIGKVSREEYERQRAGYQGDWARKEESSRLRKRNVKSWSVRKRRLKLSRRPIPREKSWDQHQWRFVLIHQRMFPIGSMLLMGAWSPSVRSIDCPSGSKMARETSMWVAWDVNEQSEGLEPYSLWAHIESKGCYPDSVLRVKQLRMDFKVSWFWRKSL